MLIMEQCQPFLKASIFIGMCVCEEYKGQENGLTGFLNFLRKTSTM